MIVLKYKCNECCIYIIDVYLPQQGCQIASFSEYLGELKGVINLSNNDGEIIVIGSTNCHFGQEVTIQCWGKTTDQARLMLNMVVKN